MVPKLKAAEPAAPSPQRRTIGRRRPTVAQVGPHPVDVHVGSRLRMARILAGKTQAWLAAQVKLTFQQLQKYERGTNRIACSMLTELATALGRPVPWFFESESAEPSDAGKIDKAVGERQRLAYELTSNFAKIGNESTRQHLVAVVRAMAEAGSRS
jgi:transcriptional regulator with XRE-family HTH domain